MHTARKFEAFLEAYRRPDGFKWDGPALQKATGGFVSRSYVHQLRKGGIANPRLDKLQALAKAMGFPPQRWFEPLADTGRFPGGAHTEAGATISERLEVLFREIPNERSGRPYGNADVAHLSAGALTELEVADIRSGAVPDPTVEQVLALAEVFAVDPSYFLDAGAKPLLLDRASLRALSNDKARQILQKSLGLSEQEHEFVLDMIARLQDLHPNPQRDDG